ncbi:hypothetical protein ACE6H2_014643 [Prunus campanulata]
MASDGQRVVVSNMEIESLDGGKEDADISKTQGDNVIVSSIKLEKILSMKGGKGELSYANNSKSQAKHARSMLPLLKETLDRVQLSSREAPFVVVDLGCSSGSNTIYIIDVIIKHMAKRYEALGYHPPEFSAFFSDLPSNDFNTLFQFLPPMANHGGSMEETVADDIHRSYFAAGVPGSFYRRLFPSRSIDVFHSAFSLHWLSQVPESVLDKKSAAYNKLKEGCLFMEQMRAQPMHTRSSSRQTWQAFSGQEPRSLRKVALCFLSVRAGPQWTPLTKGLINSEKRDSFNIPVYSSSLQDFREVVEADGSFTINKLEIFKGGNSIVVNQPDDAAEVGRAFANTCRSAVGVLIDAHIGEHLGNELFSRVEQRSLRHAKELLEHIQMFYIVASISLA